MAVLPVILETAQLLTCKFLTRTRLPLLAIHLPSNPRLATLAFLIPKANFVMTPLLEAPLTWTPLTRVTPTKLILVLPLTIQIVLLALTNMVHILLLKQKFVGVMALPTTQRLKCTLPTLQTLALFLAKAFIRILFLLSRLLAPILWHILKAVSDSPPLGHLVLIPAKATPFPTGRPINLTFVRPLTIQIPLLALTKISHMLPLSKKFLGVVALSMRQRLQHKLSTLQMLPLPLVRPLRNLLFLLTMLLLPILPHILKAVLSSPPLGKLVLIPAKATLFTINLPITLTLTTRLLPATIILKVPLPSMKLIGRLTLWITYLLQGTPLKVKSLLLVEAISTKVALPENIALDPPNRLTIVLFKSLLRLASPKLEIELQTSLPLTGVLLPMESIIDITLRLVQLKVNLHPLEPRTQRLLAMTLPIQQSLRGRLAPIAVRLPLLKATTLTKLLVGTVVLSVDISLLVVQRLNIIPPTLLPPLTLKRLPALRIPSTDSAVARCLPQNVAVALAMEILRLVQTSLILRTLPSSIHLRVVATLQILHPLRHSLPSPVILLVPAATALIILLPVQWIALLRATTLLVV